MDKPSLSRLPRYTRPSLAAPALPGFGKLFSRKSKIPSEEVSVPTTTACVMEDSTNTTSTVKKPRVATVARVGRPVGMHQKAVRGGKTMTVGRQPYAIRKTVRPPERQNPIKTNSRKSHNFPIEKSNKNVRGKESGVHKRLEFSDEEYSDVKDIPTAHPKKVSIGAHDVSENERQSALEGQLREYTLQLKSFTLDTVCKTNSLQKMDTQIDHLMKLYSKTLWENEEHD